ncbi:MAG: hypothetical protein Q7T24_04750 [Deltaproteobacteria bacterium]|nr:hypothetical protein [Deltaproteobacteria bacterium]
MKVFKAFALAPLFAGLLVTGAVAGGYGARGGGMMPQQQQMQERQGMPGAIPGQALYFSGSLTSFDPIRQEILIRTEVPGLLGPQAREVPFRVDQDTTMTICFRSINLCDSRTTGPEGVQMLNNLEGFTSLASVKKNVVVVGDPESNRVVHVQIEYEI